jgi:hypothetical protein
VGIRCGDHATPSIRKRLTSPTSGGRSVGILCSRTKATEFSFSLIKYVNSGFGFVNLMTVSGVWFVSKVEKEFFVNAAASSSFLVVGRTLRPYHCSRRKLHAFSGYIQPLLRAESEVLTILRPHLPGR